VPDELPKVTEADLKQRKDFKLIGRRDIGRVDVPSKVNGTAKYGIDVQVPGMVYASLLHAPMDGAKAESVNTDEVMKIKGVTRVIPLPFGVAVIGDTVEATRAGRFALKVKWDTSASKAAPFDSAKAFDEYARKATDPAAEVKEAFKTGDADKALSAAAKTITAAYSSEHTYHAQMEPMNAVAKVSDDGQSAEIWVGTQVQPLAAAVVAGALKTTPTRSRSTCNCSAAASAGASGRTRRCRPRAVQYPEEAGEADAHPRGRPRGGAAAADDLSRAQGRARRARATSPAGITALSPRTSMRSRRRRASRRPAGATTSAGLG
jgi:CO/xanthine dehydrogenase Mo-binding subunit